MRRFTSLTMLAFVACSDPDMLSNGEEFPNSELALASCSAGTLGETSVLPLDDNGNGNLLVAQQATLAQAGSVTSLRFFVTTADGKLRMGIYDATGPGAGPGAKKAETIEITPVVGWNTAPVAIPVSLPAGNYWLSYFASSSKLAFKKNSGGPAGQYYPLAYGSLPAAFATPTTLITHSTSHWSLYATLSCPILGEPQILGLDDSGNGNLLMAQQTSLSAAATLQSLSFYVTTAAGKLRLGIFDATGPNGGPGAKKAETNELTPFVGWNTAPVIAQVALPAGTYWLAYTPSDNNLHFRRSGTGTYRYYARAYGALPATFSTSVLGGNNHWSFYGTLNAAATTGSARLSWTPPTTNVDGTPLTDLAGYKVFSRTANGSYGTPITVGVSASPTYTFTGLASGTTYFFTVSAFDTAGNQSLKILPEVSKAIP